MARRLEIVAATAAHAQALAPQLRGPDVEECRQLGREPLDALLYGVEHGEAWAVLEDGQAIAMFGCAPFPGLPGCGVPWLLGTARMEAYGLELVRLGRRYVSTWIERYDELWNAVDARNETAVAWLESLGFHMHTTAPAPGGAPFRAFSMARS